MRADERDTNFAGTTEMTVRNSVLFPSGGDVWSQLVSFPGNQIDTGVEGQHTALFSCCPKRCIQFQTTLINV